METPPSLTIAAVIAAAGFSRRMGHFKQLLPWSHSTVIRTVVDNLHAAGAVPVLCIAGHRADEVTAALAGSPALVLPNPHYQTSEMLTSYQTGIADLANSNSQFTIHPFDRLRTPHSLLFSGVLLALADQPHIPVRVIRQVLEQARSTPEQIIIPSHQMRRGHPIYLPHRLWDELLALPVQASLRDLLNQHSAEIGYVDVDTDAIRRDMDEWGDYEGLRKEFDETCCVKREV